MPEYVQQAMLFLQDRSTHALTSLVLLAVLFIPLERLCAAREQKIFREGFWTDLGFFLGQYLLFIALANFIIHLVIQPLASVSVLGQIHILFAQIPWGLQLVIALVLGDFVAYWAHRLQHRVDILWRFHAVHHSSHEVDWLAAHREHPLDGLYTQFMVNIPAIVCGFAFSEVMLLIFFRGLWAIFIHSNVRIKVGIFGYLLGSPHLHHWHHAKGRDVGNYANLAPWLDVVFGTHYAPEGEPEEMGLDEDYPTRYMAMLIKPFTKT